MSHKKVQNSDENIDSYIKLIRNLSEDYPLLSREEEIELAKKIEKGGKKGKEAKERLILSNLRLVISIITKESFRNRGVSFKDLIQEGNEGLFVVAKKFDWRMGNRFATYATWWIRSYLDKAVTYKGSTIRVAAHMKEAMSKVSREIYMLEKSANTVSLEDMEHISDKTGVPLKKVKSCIALIKRGKTLSFETPLSGDDKDGRTLESSLKEEAEEGSLSSMIEAKDLVGKFLSCLKPKEKKVLRLRFGIEEERDFTLEEVGKILGVTRERVRQIQNKALKKLKNEIDISKLRDKAKARSLQFQDRQM